MKVFEKGLVFFNYKVHFETFYIILDWQPHADKLLTYRIQNYFHHKMFLLKTIIWCEDNDSFLQTK